MATPFNLKLTIGEGPVNFVTDRLKYTRKGRSIKSEGGIANETIHFESIIQSNLVNQSDPLSNQNEDSESPKRKRRRTAGRYNKGGTRYPELDEILFKWLDHQEINPDDEVVVKQAHSFAKEIGIGGFSGTTAWSKAFFNRYKAHKAEKLEVLSCSRKEP